MATTAHVNPQLLRQPRVHPLGGSQTHAVDGDDNDIVPGHTHSFVAENLPQAGSLPCPRGARDIERAGGVAGEVLSEVGGNGLDLTVPTMQLRGSNITTTGVKSYKCEGKKMKLGGIFFFQSRLTRTVA